MLYTLNLYQKKIDNWFCTPSTLENPIKTGISIKDTLFSFCTVIYLSIYLPRLHASDICFVNSHLAAHGEELSIYLSIFLDCTPLTSALWTVTWLHTARSWSAETRNGACSLVDLFYHLLGFVKLQYYVSLIFCTVKTSYCLFIIIG